MTHFMCATCGTQFAASDTPPAACPICEDERQYIGYNGQRWITLEQLQSERRADIRAVEPDLSGIGIEPSFSIGQRALLVRTPEGNLLWDCISLINDEIVAALHEQGGVRAIAISHPHYYSSMVEWAHTFDAPIYLHSADREHVMRPDPSIEFWEGETLDLFGGLRLLRLGGHFAGGQVAHWPAGAEGRGVMLTGDIIMVAQDRRYVSFMYSYPNMIPLPAREVSRIAAAVEPYAFDRIYGAWWERVVDHDAHAAVARSAARYIAAIQG